MDSQIAAADIVRYAQDEASWRRDILDFNEVPPPALAQQMKSQAPLANTMRQGQISQGGRVAQAEAGLRDLLSTSAQLTAAAENPAPAAASHMADNRILDRRRYRRSRCRRRASHVWQHAACHSHAVVIQQSADLDRIRGAGAGAAARSARDEDRTAGMGSHHRRCVARTAARPGNANRPESRDEPMSYWLIAPGPFRGVGHIRMVSAQVAAWIDLERFHGRARPRPGLGPPPPGPESGRIGQRAEPAQVIPRPAGGCPRGPAGPAARSEPAWRTGRAPPSARRSGRPRRGRDRTR